MFRSVVEAAEKSWAFYEPLTLLSFYNDVQKRLIRAYAPYRHLAERYSNTVDRKVYPITEEYLQENPEIAEQNVALLKNAIELWKMASQTNDAVAPILYHYSWHCFNSFFAYTFFSWEPLHSSSHGINIPSETLSENIEEIKIKFHEETIKEGRTRGLFQRLIDTWTLLGTSLAFSPFLPVFKGQEIEFQPNKLYLLGNSKEIKIGQLLHFDPVEDYERKYWKTYGRGELLQNTSLSNSMNLPTNILKSYLIIFASSSIARYRPVLWGSILLGKEANQARFALNSRKALLNYAQYGINSLSFLQEISFLLKNMIDERFELQRLP